MLAQVSVSSYARIDTLITHTHRAGWALKKNLRQQKKITTQACLFMTDECSEIRSRAAIVYNERLIYI